MNMVTGKRVCCTYLVVIVVGEFGKTMVTTSENRYDKYIGDSELNSN